MFTVEILIGCLIFGVYTVACFKILQQYSIVRETLMLANDDDVITHLPSHFTQKHNTFVCRTKTMLITYWVVWYPLMILTGSTYAWFLTAAMVDPLTSWSLVVVVFLTLTLTSTIVKGVLYPFPPMWFAEWSVAVALTNNKLLTDRVNNIIARVNDEVSNEHVKRYHLEQLLTIQETLRHQRSIIDQQSTDQ